jgi:hypothetical protein
MKNLTKKLTEKNIKHDVRVENNHHVLYIDNEAIIKKRHRSQSIFFVDQMLLDAISDLRCIERKMELQNDRR